MAVRTLEALRAQGIQGVDRIPVLVPLEGLRNREVLREADSQENANQEPAQEPRRASAELSEAGTREELPEGVAVADVREERNQVERSQEPGEGSRGEVQNQAE